MRAVAIIVPSPPSTTIRSTLCGQLVVLDRLDRAAGLVLDPLALDFRAADNRDAARAEPLDQMADGLQRLRLVRLDEDADTSDSRLGHPVNAMPTKEQQGTARTLFHAGKSRRAYPSSD